MKKEILTVSKAEEKLENKITIFNRFSKYIIDYKINDNIIEVISNLNKTCKVKNNHTNINKLNKLIIKNKIEIVNKINEYDANRIERIILIMCALLVLGGTCIIVPFTFFIGSYPLFIISVILFSFAVLLTSSISFSLYMQVKEVRKLREIIEYKKEIEFYLPNNFKQNI